MTGGRTLVLAGLLVLASIVLASVVLGHSTAATEGGSVDQLAEEAKDRAAHVYALGRLSDRAWTTRLGSAGLGIAVSLAASSTVAFLYYRRSIR